MGFKRVFRLFFAYAVFMAAVITIPAAHNLYAAPQMDGTGFSDPLLVDITGSGLAWSFQSSRSDYARNRSLSTLGINGNHLIPSYWTNSVLTEIGVASLEKDGRVRWRIVPIENDTAEIHFGSSDDLMVSGGDYNSNGLGDIGLIGSDGQVRMYLDPFQGGSVVDLEGFTKRQKNRGKAFYTNFYGSGDALALYVAVKNSRKVVTVDRYGNRVGLRLSRSKNLPLRAMPIADQQQLDNVLVVEQIRARKRIVVHNKDGERIYVRRVPAGATIVVGDYLPDPGEEFGIYVPKKGTLLVTNPLSGSSRSLALPNKRVIADHINVFTFKKELPIDDTPEEPNLSKVCPGGVVDVPSGSLLWKPDADASDARKGKPVVLYTGSRKPGTAAIAVYAGNGQQVCQFTYKASSIAGVNCGAAHYFSGWSGGCAATASQIAAAASSSSGSSSVYIQGRGGVCYGPITPTARSGGISC